MDWDVFYMALRVGICCVAFAWLVFLPLKSRYRHESWLTGILVIGLIAITITVTILFLNTGKFYSEYSNWGILFWLLSAVLVFHLTIEGSFYEILFIVLVVLNLYANIMVIAKTIVSVVHWNLSDEASKAIVATAVLVLFLPLFWVLMFKLYKQVVEFPNRLSFWKRIWSIPALTYLVFYVKMIADYWRKPVHTGGDDIIFSILWSFITYALFYVTLEMLIQAYKGATAAQQARLITAQLRLQEEQYERLIKNYEQTARQKHDWRHHLLSLSGFAENEEYEALQCYLKELLPAYNREVRVNVCQNHVIDVILCHYMAAAAEHGISMAVKVNIPQDTGISDSNLSIVFGNLLENAVAASMKQKQGPRSIEVKAAYEGKQLTALFQNTHEEIVKCKNGCFLSTKHQGEGIGLESVRGITKQCKGTMKVDYDERKFTVYVLLFAHRPS